MIRLVFILSFFFHQFAMAQVYSIPKVYEKEFRPYLIPKYWVVPEKKRLSETVRYRFRVILSSKIQVSEQNSNLAINLIKWPSEDKLIYRIGNSILNQN